MEGKRIEELYKLLKRAEKEKDYDAVSALSWVISRLEEKRIDKLYELLERADHEKDTFAAIALREAISTFGAGGERCQRNK